MATLLLLDWSNFLFWAGIVLCGLGLLVMILALLLFAGLKKLDEEDDIIHNS